MRHRHRAAAVQALSRDLGDADRLAARRLRAAPPVVLRARCPATAGRPTARETRAARGGPAARRKTRASRGRRRARPSSAPRRDRSRTRTCPCDVSTTMTGAVRLRDQRPATARDHEPQRRAKTADDSLFCAISASLRGFVVRRRHRFDGRVTPICGQCARIAHAPQRG